MPVLPRSVQRAQCCELSLPPRLPGLILLPTDPASSDLLARVSLRVPQEDVVFAMQNDPLVSELFQLIIPFLSG